MSCEEGRFGGCWGPPGGLSIGQLVGALGLRQGQARGGVLGHQGLSGGVGVGRGQCGDVYPVKRREVPQP